MRSASRADIVLFVALVIACLIYGMRPPSVASSPDCPADAPAVTIAAYGDSTTQGWDDTHNMPYYLQPLLCHATVSNEGVSGTRADQLLNGLDGRHQLWAQEMQRSSAHIILLNYGINDARAGVPLETYTLYMRELVRVAKAQGKQVVLQTPNPIFLTQGSDVPDENLQYYAKAIRRLAKAEQVPVIDVNQHMLEALKQQPVKALYADALHPSALTYAFIAGEAARILRNLH